MAAALVEAETALSNARLQAKPDVKLVKELEAKCDSLRDGNAANGALLVPFDRMLIGKTELRTFNVTNPCDLPVAYAIDLLDFVGSPNIGISPTSGTLAPGALATIAVTFFSNDPLEVKGMFTLRYSDVEGGLSEAARTTSRQFSVTAEAYKITAVSLTSAGQETGGYEVDFGVVRVGDYAHKMLKMLNKGKYKIAYKINFKRQATASFLLLEPAEGLIDPGATVDIKVTFCAKTDAVSLASNKDVRITISEPITNEAVEEFPLYVSSQAVYTKYRMQPARGVSFGAVRFDSDAKAKRVELRNEVNYYCKLTLLSMVSISYKPENY